VVAHLGELDPAEAARGRADDLVGVRVRVRVRVTLTLTRGRADDREDDVELVEVGGGSELVLIGGEREARPTWVRVRVRIGVGV